MCPASLPAAKDRQAVDGGNRQKDSTAGGIDHFDTQVQQQLSSSSCRGRRRSAAVNWIQSWI
jgi:hypothetical protein